MGPTLFFPPTILIFFIIVFPDGESFWGDNCKSRGDGGKRESLLLSALVGDTNVIIDDVDLVNVTEAHLAYFDAIGAVGPVADESQ